MKKNIHKISARILSLCTALCLVTLWMGACGSSVDETFDTDMSENPAPGTEHQQEEAFPNESASTYEKSETSGNTAEDDTKTDINVSIMESSVSVIMETEVKPLIDKNGMTYYTLSSTYPIISIEGNESAAEKINEDIRSRIGPFLSETASYEVHKNWAAYLHETEPERTDTLFEEDISYKVTRADDNVISFAITNYFYDGGFHGQFNTIGVNYDTSTGEPIAFDDLSDNPESFRAATLAYNLALTETEAYSSLMYPKDADSIASAGTPEDVLYSDDRWCLSSSGLVFLSNPYALGPFAAGLIEFTIPYSDLEDMGFNEAYTYTDRLIVKLLDRETYDVDLNGDNIEENVSYYCEFLNGDETGTGTYEKRVHLIIDAFDLGQNGDDDTRELLADYMYSKLVLYDLDIDDSYVELVLLTGWATGRENTYYSNFFRYTSDGSLVYLGRVKGDVTDISVSASELERIAAPSITDTTVSNAETSVSIAMENEKKALTTDDGITYITLGCTYPVIAIEGNDAAAEKINADIRSRIDSFYAERDYCEWLKSDIDYLREHEPDRTNTNYQNYLIYWVQRADDKVVSFIVEDTEYMGGMHPNSTEIGINYHTETGNVITFESLSDDPEAFYAATLAYNKKLAAADVYDERMFSQNYITDGTLESALYSGDAWYLTTYGLCFRSDPYELGAYTAGAIEFIIPYNALKKMGLKDVYTYPDRLIVKFPDIGISENTIDLNGDGSIDIVESFYRESYNTENNSFSYHPHFTVSGIDFALDGTDDVKEKLAGDSPIICLFDLNVNDSYIELVTLSWEHGPDGYDLYSHFFRYTKTCSLIYLGMVKGDVTDPTVTVSELERDTE